MANTYTYPRLTYAEQDTLSAYMRSTFIPRASAAALLLQLSHSAFNRRVFATYGEPFIHMAARARVRSAATMIAMEPFTELGEIARRHGWKFGKSSAMQYSFNTHLGMSAGAWRAHVHEQLLLRVTDQFIRDLVQEQLHTAAARDKNVR